MQAPTHDSGHESRVVRLAGADNVRDLGGLPTTDGRLTIRGRLFRGELLPALVEADVDVLIRKAGLRTVVDLRSPGEIAHEPGRWLEHEVAWISCPFRLHDVRAAVGPHADQVGSYLDFLAGSADIIALAIRTLIDPASQPALFHCAAGKDRTGVVAALLLDVLGVDRAAIADDYAMTAIGLPQVLDRLAGLAPYNRTLTGAADAPARTPENKTITTFLDEVDRLLGGPAAWLSDIGVDPTSIESFRATMLEPGCGDVQQQRRPHGASQTDRWQGDGVQDPRSQFDLTGRVVLVTGGSRGLGREMVLAMAAVGADVVIASRKLEACEETAEEVRRTTGRRALPVAAHMARWDDAEALADAAYAEFGKVDVLVNNAGMSPVYPDPASVSEELWDKVLAVNLKGPFRLTALIGTRMADGEGGSIINISSSAARFPMPDVVPYAAAKAGLNAMTQAFARTWPNVRVNSILPGTFLTDVAQAWDQEAFARQARSFALKRGGEPHEIVGAALYLASDASSYTTGALLDVDGGYLPTVG